MVNSLKTPVGLPSQGAPLADWLVALSHDSPFERPEAGAALGGASPPLAAAPSLLAQLKDADRDVRLRAVTALGDLAAEVRRLLPVIRVALGEAAHHDADDGVRTEAVRAFLRAGPQPATDVAALVDALRSDVEVVRFHAAVTLGDLGPAAQAAVPALIHASLWDDDPAVRVESAMALWKIDDQKGPLVFDVLTQALAHANELICWIAAECLGRIGPAARQAVPALRQALQREFRLALVTSSVRLALERIDPQGPGEAGEASEG
jgi:HEAT repeat protein